MTTLFCSFHSSLATSGPFGIISLILRSSINSPVASCSIVSWVYQHKAVWYFPATYIQSFMQSPCFDFTHVLPCTRTHSLTQKASVGGCATSIMFVLEFVHRWRHVFSLMLWVRVITCKDKNCILTNILIIIFSHPWKWGPQLPITYFSLVMVFTLILWRNRNYCPLLHTLMASKTSWRQYSQLYGHLWND